MNHQPPWRTIYDRIAPFLALLVLIIAMAAGVGTYVNDQNDRDRDRAITAANTARLEDNAALLDCFDRFATTLAGGLPPVRAASAHRDDTLEAALTGLSGVLRDAVSGKEVTPSDVRKLVALFDGYAQASRDLDQIREANPYPEAPSEFCAGTSTG